MRPLGFFDRRIRGFRVVELGAAGFLLILVLVVYMAKTGAGDKRADIDRVQQQMDDETTQIRLLRAEVATLEQPERLEALSAQYLNLQPISAKHEVTPEALADIMRAPADPTAAAATTASASPTTAAPTLVAAASATPAPTTLSTAQADKDAAESAKADQASNAPAPGERRYILATATIKPATKAKPPAKAAIAPVASAAHVAKKPHPAATASIDSMLEAASTPEADHAPRELH